MKCPLCKSRNNNQDNTIASSKLSGSLLYDDIIIMKCGACGHVYNDITGWDAAEYYKREYKETKFTPTISINDFLGIEHDNNCAIITQNDIDKWVDMLININNNKYNDLWPKRNFVALDQFLEHCWNIDAVMHYLRHTVPLNNMVYISVPDYERYENEYYFLIKEHIHHFSLLHIIALLKRYGFVLHESRFSTIDILNGGLQMPIIECIFINKKSQGVYCYGASREFMHALENGCFNNIIIDGIIDDTPFKQGRYIGGIPIIKSDDIDDNAEILITAGYNNMVIRDKLKGHKGSVRDIWDI